ncbi:MAG: sigma-70 family RNA polymerase sigma factor [Candidatus Acidiferrales bacterium]
MNDADLWEKICAGDTSAFEALFREVGPRLRSFLRIYSGAQVEAEDIVQETFLQMWKRPNAFDPARGTLKQYLYGIARKRVAQKWRETPQSLASAEHREAQPGLVVDPKSSGAGGGLAAAMREGLMRLDVDERGLLWLREVEGYSYGELAGILGIPLGTVKSRLFTARENLRQIWVNGKRN